MKEEGICGAETLKEEPCRNPPGDNGRCWIPSHNPNSDEKNVGRPKKIGEREEELVLTAVRAGLKFEDQANHAQVHPKTLRRHLCCIDSPREGVITDEDPCDFCRDYAHAHSEGALRVLEECRPEFRASASFGYTKKEKHEVEADVDQTTTHELGDEERELALQAIRELQERESNE